MTCEEFAGLLEEEGTRIYSFCCQLTGSRSEAEDLYQETMLVAMEKCGKIDSAGNPKSLLMGIAAGVWKNKRRRYARRQRIAPQESLEGDWSYPEAPDRDGSPEEAYLFRELCELVRVEAAALKEKYRLPVYMYYSAEMSVEEIAAALHIPRGTVKSRLHEARRIMKKKLEEYGYEG